MIKVKMFQGQRPRNCVEIHALPLRRPEDYHCVPEGSVSFGTAQQLANELADGRVSGLLAGYRWFRQAGR